MRSFQFKGIVYINRQFCSNSFTILYSPKIVRLSSVEHKRKYLEEYHFIFPSRHNVVLFDH